MLTASEREWLEHRDAMQFLMGTYIADFADFPLWNNGKDWQDALEFSERVAVKLAEGIAIIPYLRSADALKFARFAVEEEMDGK